MKRQQFFDGPAMIRNLGGHGRCPLHRPPTGPRTGEAQARMIRTEVVDRTDPIHAMLQSRCTARQCSAAPGQRRQSLTERRVQPLDVCRVDHPVALRAAPEGLDACGRTSNNPALHLDNPPLHIALDDLRDADIAPGAQAGTPQRTRMYRITERLTNGANSEHNPSVHNSIGRRRAQARTRSIRRRINIMSRCLLTSPASHRRVLTIIARAIQTTPPCFLTRISSACTCPRARGRSTTCSWTAWPCMPARCNQAATVRSSTPNATTMACRGHRRHQGHDPGHRVRRRPQTIQRRASGGGEGLVTLGTDEAFLLTRVDANVALAGLASGRTRQIGAEDGRGVHAHPPPGFA